VLDEEGKMPLVECYRDFEKLFSNWNQWENSIKSQFEKTLITFLLQAMIVDEGRRSLMQIFSVNIPQS
jgi:hypothetical protein